MGSWSSVVVGALVSVVVVMWRTGGAASSAGASAAARGSCGMKEFEGFENKHFFFHAINWIRSFSRDGKSPSPTKLPF